jgi:hypothetical protein
MRRPPHDGQEAAALTREGDDAVEPALVAVHAHEAVGEDPAAQERSELALDKAGCRALKSTAAGQEALQPTPDGAVEHALLGAVPLEAVAHAPAGGVRARRCTSGSVHSGECLPQAREWSHRRFVEEHGLYQLLGTIRYPGAVHAT